MPIPAYQDPVAQLLTLGYPEDLNSPEAIDYLQNFGFTDVHIPELSRLAAEEDLNWDDEGEGYSPMHACRALGQLKTEKAIQALLTLFDSEYDFLREELPTILGKIGPTCIPILSGYLAEGERPWLGISTAASGLTKIAQLNPDYRQECIDELTTALARHKEQAAETNGSLVVELINLKATGAVSVIERAYKEGPMDEMFCGSWAKVQIALGLATEADFSPEELQHQEPEWMEQIRRLANMTTELAREQSKLPDFSKGALSQNRKKSGKKTTGFGAVKPKNKKRKKK
ncbi:HEAT repeat domain-containing protein [Acaryochloris sp. CCMEE 5410]|uniref:HEAT repeat domain-containing protein n=1 Tax=Acaryochloris sp. CCMEE 5410 TaxID=310037 RepID=UPI0002484D0E|nr:HEAT repeat domain-containing protein [Acaryochloris sp. CCMEE 5410]KAI9133554.1 HEAT repeat domain-containing protein [Acaryochloris sp. CCMEE 5410]